MSFLTGQGSGVKTWHRYYTSHLTPRPCVLTPREGNMCSPQGRPSPQAPLTWAPSFFYLLSQAGRPSVCSALCPVALHHPELLTSDLRFKFSHLLVHCPNSSSGNQYHQCLALDVPLIRAFLGMFQTKGRRVGHQTALHRPPVISSSETSCRPDLKAIAVWPLMGLQGHLRGQVQWWVRREYPIQITLEASGTHSARG